jgi:hypothetical protein
MPCAKQAGVDMVGLLHGDSARREQDDSGSDSFEIEVRDAKNKHNGKEKTRCHFMWEAGGVGKVT